MNYYEFLKSKIVKVEKSGIDIDADEVNPNLLPHQRDAVIWAVKGGRRALFENFGLGKTVQQLEWCRLLTKHEGGKALIVLPLGVKQEFKRDAVELLGMEEPQYITSMEQVRNSESKIFITNYERVRDCDIDPKFFTATALDEASVLRSFGSKTFQTFLEKFRGVKYKLVSTATPSPNKHKELIHYAGYLEIMDTGQALTRFFKRDSTKANNLTLYPHKEDEFWLWVASWATVLTKPSDLRYSDEGYALPPLDIRTHVLQDDYKGIETKTGQLKLIKDTTRSLTEAAKEKSESIGVRIAKAKEIVDSDPDSSFILWHDREAVNKKFNSHNLRFRLFKSQINGGLEECCDVLINGVPFLGANTAAQVLIGVDIINTLTNIYDIQAPIWIDNKESITEEIQSNSQVITLTKLPARSLQ